MPMPEPSSKWAAATNTTPVHDWVEANQTTAKALAAVIAAVLMSRPM